MVQNNLSNNSDLLNEEELKKFKKEVFAYFYKSGSPMNKVKEYEIPGRSKAHVKGQIAIFVESFIGNGNIGPDIGVKLEKALNRTYAKGNTSLDEALEPLHAKVAHGVQKIRNDIVKNRENSVEEHGKNWTAGAEQDATTRKKPGGGFGSMGQG